MTQDQVTSLIRSLIQTFGGVIAGFFAAKGWFTIDQVTSVLNSPTFLGLITSAIMALWGLWAHTPTNIVASANALPAVAGVVTTATPAGSALAASVPASTVAMAGSSAAKQVAAAPTL